MSLINDFKGRCEAAKYQQAEGIRVSILLTAESLTVVKMKSYSWMKLCVMRNVPKNHLLKPRHLDQPTLLLRVDLMIDGPFGKLVPFIDILPVD